MRCGYSRLLLVVRPGGRPPSTRQNTEYRIQNTEYRMAYRMACRMAYRIQIHGPTEYRERIIPVCQGVKKLSEESGLRNPSNQLM